MKNKTLLIIGLLALSLTCGCGAKKQASPSDASASSPIINDVEQDGSASFLDQAASSETSSADGADSSFEETDTSEEGEASSNETPTTDGNSEAEQVNLSKEEQIDLIATKLPDLLGAHSALTITDLDDNGRMELILAEPDFLIYEISEDGTDLCQTAIIDQNNDNYPSVYSCGNKLLFTDRDGIRHYLWSGSTYVDEDTCREYENEYIYVNGGMMCENLRTVSYSLSGATEDVYSYGMEYMTAEEYANLLKDIYESGEYQLQYSTMQWLYFIDDLSEDEDEILSTLTNLYDGFSVTDVELPYFYDDCDGKWLLTAGSVEGCEFELEPEDQTSHLYFHDGLVDYIDDKGNNTNAETANLLPTLVFTSSYENPYWLYSLPDNDVFRYGTVTFTEDGRLCFSAQLMYGEDDYGSILWYFEKEE